MILMDKKLI